MFPPSSSQVGDVVGCLLEVDSVGQTASMSFMLNGKSMGVAFDSVKLAPPSESTDTLLKVNIVH